MTNSLRWNLLNLIKFLQKMFSIGFRELGIAERHMEAKWFEGISNISEKNPIAIFLKHSKEGYLVYHPRCEYHEVVPLPRVGYACRR